jgi:hypothetical protein
MSEILLQLDYWKWLQFIYLFIYLFKQHTRGNKILKQNFGLKTSYDDLEERGIDERENIL